jgi:hypothetical protein
VAVGSDRISPANRALLATRRLILVLRTHGVPLWRTLEQKISDAGPPSMRVNPHVLTDARRPLVEQGRIRRLQRGNTPWLHLNSTRGATVARRLAEQEPVHLEMQTRDVILRLGQALEIAVYRSLSDQSSLDFLGAFRDLDAHDDSTLYSKEEPPVRVSGRGLDDGSRLDFLVRHTSAGWGAIEVKNIREWLYPDRQEIRDLVRKAVAFDAVAVLIARRVPYVTFVVLNRCGIIIHQTYNQRFPEASRALGEKAAHKRLLGFHDIRFGNQPDARLNKFLHVNLPDVLSRAREDFDQYKDLLSDYRSGRMPYEEFAARVRRRTEGVDEDFDAP